MGLSVLAAIGFAVGISKRKVKPAVIFPVIMICVGILGAGAGRDQQGKQISRKEHRIYAVRLRDRRCGQKDLQGKFRSGQHRYKQQHGYHIQHQDKRL